MPTNLVQICFTYMCENNELYVVGETDETYEIYNIALDVYQDMSNKNELNRLFNYRTLAKIDKIQEQEDPNDERIRHVLNNNMLIGFHVKSQQADDDDENAADKIAVLLLYQKDTTDTSLESCNSIWIW
jgi:hypothetical protein